VGSSNGSKYMSFSCEHARIKDNFLMRIGRDFKTFRTGAAGKGFTVKRRTWGTTVSSNHASNPWSKFQPVRSRNPWCIYSQPGIVALSFFEDLGTLPPERLSEGGLSPQHSLNTTAHQRSIGNQNHQFLELRKKSPKGYNQWFNNGN
jgi:hypothetical protein